MRIKIHGKKVSILLFLILSVTAGYPQNDFPGKSAQRDTRSCGQAVLEYLKTRYYPSGTEIELPQNTVSLHEMLLWSKKLNPDARAVDISKLNFDRVPMPAILHLSSGHYILLKDYDGNRFSIYDPAAPHLLKVSRSYLDYFSSQKAIVFSDNSSLRLLNAEELETAKGSFSHEFPPPNQTEDGYHRGRSRYNRPQGECRNNRSRRGSPLFSFNPVILNVVLEDVPMWYDAGIGPDFELGLTYNSNDQQEITGGGSSYTQYFPFGKRWSFTYGTFYTEISGTEIMFIMPDGSREKFTWDNGAFVPSHTDNHNHLERYPVAGGYGYLLTEKETRLKYRYDNPVHHKLTSIEDLNGNIVTLNYDINYNLISVTDANGRSVTFTLNQDGRIIQATDPMGRTALFEYGYTDNEFLTEITDMGGFTSTLEYDEVQVVSQSGYNMESQIVAVTTPTGTTNLTWTATGIICPGKLAFYWTFTNPDGISATTYFSYGEATQGIIKMGDNNGLFDIFYVDLPNYRVTHIEKPDPDASVFYGYDGSGNINSIIVGSFEEQYVYDESGNIIQFIDQRGKTTQFSFDENNNLISIVDPMNRMISFEYDENDNLINFITPVSAQHYTYFPNGNMASYTDGLGRVTTFSYDNFGYLSGVSYPDGSPTTIVNNSVGKVVSLTDRGITTQYEYDDLDNITRVIYPDGTYDQYTYDLFNLREIVDRGHRKIEFEYDGMNEIVSASGPKGYLTLDRDGNGNITRLSINAQSTFFVYDGLNRVIAEINTDGTSRQFTYNEIGNILTRVDENGVLTTYTYDFNLLTEIDYGDDTPDVSFEYNDNGEITSLADGTGITTLSYDEGGRLIEISGTGKDNHITYTYDSAYNRKTMSIDGLTVEFSYDDLNRISHVESNYSEASYSYDDNSNLIKAVYGNDSYTDYNYDGQNRIKSIYHKKSNGDMLFGFEYAFNDVTLLEKITDQRGVISNYNYDYSYQLINELVSDPKGKILWHHKYSYDNLGNILNFDRNGVENIFYYNNLNQLVSETLTSIDVNGIIYGDSTSNVYVDDIKAKTTYLGNGQLLFEATGIPIDMGTDTIQLYARVNDVLATVDDSSKFICTSKTLPNDNIKIYLFGDIENVNPENINTIYIKKDLIYYEYDDNGNLIKRLSPYDTTQYSYDAENRLVEVRLPGGDIERYVYDAFGQRAEVWKNGNLFKKYIYDNYFQAIAIEDDEGNKQYLTRGLGLPGGLGGIIGIHDPTEGDITNYFNHRGDLVGATNTDEDILFTGEYDAFGNRIFETGLYNSRFGFSSKEFDPATGFYNFGGRYYSPANSRWITRDPLGLDAGFNLYAFVGNNPIMMIDPFGYDIPPDIERGLRTLNDAFNSTAGTITRETVINTIENLARVGKLAPNFLSRVSGLARAGSVFTGVLQTFLSPEGAEAMRGAIQLTRALQRENELVRKMNLLGCGKRLRPGQRRLARAARRFKRSFIGRLLFN
jgi:RHS repeat-associated protein